MRRLDGHEFEQTPGDSEGPPSFPKPAMLQSLGSKRVGHDLTTPRWNITQPLKRTTSYHLWQYGWTYRLY